MSETHNRVSPIVVIAAVSVIVFSAVGVGVMTGLIPSSLSKGGDQQVAAKTEAQQQAASPPAPEKKITSTAPKRSAAGEPTRMASAPAVCTNCGTVESVNVIAQKGDGSGLGAIAGGVAGAVLGNQVGGGSGRKIATVAGAAGGAYAGHQVEKHVKSTNRYEVSVRMQDGSVRAFYYDNQPAYRAGDKVKVVDGALFAG